MRMVWLNKDDFEMFHQDISPMDYEFFRTHVDTFKRMWREQTRRFWMLFVSTFEHFIWKHGCVKDFPMKSREVTGYVDEILEYIKQQFVYGKVSTAKKLINDCVIVTQNRHCITILDRATYAQNPFYMKETREVFRELFGSPNDKKTYMKVLCGLSMYVKFAGSAVVALRRWMDAGEIDPENKDGIKNYFDNIYVRHRGFELDEPLDESLLAELATELNHGATGKEIELTKKKKRKKKSKCKSTDENSEPSDLTKDCDAATGGEDCLPADLTETTDSKDSSNRESSVAQTSDKKLDPVLAERGKEPASGSSDPKKTDLDATASVSGGAVKSDNKKQTSSDDGRDSEKGGAKRNVAVETAESAVSDDTDGKTRLLLLNEPEVKVQCSADSAQVGESAEKRQGEGLVAKEDMEASKDDGSSRKKLHICGLCGREEVTAKTFKRCQKCRGKVNPKYYCSRECQVRDWKTHKLDHKDDP